MTGTLFGRAGGHWRAQLRFDAPKTRVLLRPVNLLCSLDISRCLSVIPVCLEKLFTRLTVFDSARWHSSNPRHLRAQDQTERLHSAIRCASDPCIGTSKSNCARQ